MVERVILYEAPTTVVDTEVLANWLDERLDATVTCEDRFLERCIDDDALAVGFAESRVRSPNDRTTGNTMLGVVRYESRVLADPARAGGVLYDGIAIQHLLRRRLSSAERGLDQLHVILLDRAIGTWGHHDGRWHKRINVLGQPAIISIPGLYEAPAKPEAYYHIKQSHAMLSGDTPPREVLEGAVDGAFLAADDPRTTDALKGIVLQAVHYLETGTAFCDDNRCRLYNAHHHEELVRAQLESPSFCETHAARYG